MELLLIIMRSQKRNVLAQKGAKKNVKKAKIRTAHVKSVVVKKREVVPEIRKVLLSD
jgi:hypothetical protein